MEELKKEYKILQKKYNLPNFEDLDKEFEIRALEVNKCGILIKAILRVINNKVGIFLNYLEPVVSPPQQIMHYMIEYNNISSEDKKPMYEFYKELSYLYHKDCRIELEDNKVIAAQINEIWKKWPSILNKIKLALEKINEAWLKEKEKTKRNNYMG